MAVFRVSFTPTATLILRLYSYPHTERVACCNFAAVFTAKESEVVVVIVSTCEGLHSSNSLFLAFEKPNLSFNVEVNCSHFWEDYGCQVSGEREEHEQWNSLKLILAKAHLPLLLTSIELVWLPELESSVSS